MALGTRVLITPRRRQLVESLVASGALQAALFASGIIMARSLGPAGRGDLALVLLLPSVTIQLVSLGIPAALTYFIAKHRPAWRTLSLRLTLIVAAQASVALLLLLVANAVFLSDKSRATQTAGNLVLLSVPLLLVYSYSLAIYQGLSEIRWFNIFRVAPPALFAAGIAAAVIGDLTIIRATEIWMASQFLVALTMAGKLAMRDRSEGGGTGPPDLPGAGEISRFGVTGFLAQVSPLESFRIDQLAVAAFFPSVVVGYYVVAASASNIPRFIADGIAAVAYPHVTEHRLPQALASTRKYLLAAAVLCGGTAVLVAATLPWLIPLLFGREFEPAVSISMILVLAAGVISIRRVGTDCLRAQGRPAAATRNELLTWLILVPALLTMGRLGEGDGIAAALALSSAIGLGLLLTVLRRQERAGRQYCVGSSA